MAEPKRKEGELTTADLASYGVPPKQPEKPKLVKAPEPETLGQAPAVSQRVPLFTESEMGDFRSQWRKVQTGFVDEPRRTVEHAQPLRHVVQRRTLQPALGAPPAGRKQPGDGGGAERERQCHDGTGDGRGIIRQQAQDPARSDAEEGQESGDKADHTRQNHEWPTADCLGKGLSDNHSLCASL